MNEQFTPYWLVYRQGKEDTNFYAAYGDANPVRFNTFDAADAKYREIANSDPVPYPNCNWNVYHVNSIRTENNLPKGLTPLYPHKTPHWDSHTAYSKDEVVMFEGHEYVCVQPVEMVWGTGNEPNTTPFQSHSWQLKNNEALLNYADHDVGDDKDTIQMNLPDRAQQHGDWVANSRVYDDLCNILLGKIKMQEIPGDVIGLHIEEASARSAVSMIAMKLARIATGNIQEPDHWLDIAGYARLHYDLLMKGKDNDKQ